MLFTSRPIPMHDPVSRESHRKQASSGVGRGSERDLACDSKYLNNNDLRSFAWIDQTSKAGVCLG